MNGFIIYFRTSIYNMQHAWGRGKENTGVWWGNPRERDHLEEPGVDGRIIKKDGSFRK
jgi:hypothetical protein